MSGSNDNAVSIRSTSSAETTVVESMDSSYVDVGEIGAGDPSPANQQHVDYILVAEFSIDKGSMMEFQYPAPISGDEQ
jgi:hypothetical protein